MIFPGWWFCWLAHLQWIEWWVSVWLVGIRLKCRASEGAPSLGWEQSVWLNGAWCGQLLEIPLGVHSLRLNTVLGISLFSFPTLLTRCRWDFQVQIHEFESSYESQGPWRQFIEAATLFYHILLSAPDFQLLWDSVSKFTSAVLCVLCHSRWEEDKWPTMFLMTVLWWFQETEWTHLITGGNLDSLSTLCKMGLQDLELEMGQIHSLLTW